MIDVIIPTIPGREDSLLRTESSLTAHTTQDIDLNFIVVQNSETCGWGWRRGLRMSQAPYVLLATDDQEYVNTDWTSVCMETVDEGLLPCPRVFLADGRIESNGGDMKEFCHVHSRPRRDLQPCDYTTIPFMSREQADAIGMIDVHYSSDVWVSYRGRQLGYETLLRHGFDVVHHVEAHGRGAGMAQPERDAIDEQTMREELAKCAV